MVTFHIPYYAVLVVYLAHSFGLPLSVWRPSILWGNFMYSCLYHQLLLCYQIQRLNCTLFSVLVSLLRRKAAENELEKSDVPTTYFDV